jgi:hypothetical protein
VFLSSVYTLNQSSVFFDTVCTNFRFLDITFLLTITPHRWAMVHSPF